MDMQIDFDKLIGEKELNAYNNYIKLTSYENFVHEAEEANAIQIDYGTRDFSYPLDLCFKKE